MQNSDVMTRLQRSDTFHVPRRRKQQPCLLLCLRLLGLLALLSASTFARAEAVSAQPVDPKIACRTEEIITSLAISPPDKLDFFGEDKGQGNYHCEAYFSYKAYADVWNRVNAMMPKLRKVEAACAASALLKLPKLDALQLQYDITLAGKYRITGAGDLPIDPQALSRTLRSQIAQLQGILAIDDATLRSSFALHNCPLAKYQDIP